MASSAVMIAPITRDDLSVIAQLHATSWRKAYRGILGDDYLDGDLVAERTRVWRAKLEAPEAGLGWMAAHDGQAIGFVYLCPRIDARWGSLVDNLHVLPGHQGLGVGRQLLHQVGAWCAEHAASAGVYLWVFTDNTPARGFYARVGGQEVEAVEKEASDGRWLPELRVAWNSPAHLLDATRAATQL
jgi:GNAT superfamily N-acetyltransferase